MTTGCVFGIIFELSLSGGGKKNLEKEKQEFLEKNFYTLINEYRVQEVIRRMNDKQYQMYTLLAIALDAGFNSKSAFNRIFKQITGKTPSEYKLEMQD